MVDGKALTWAGFKIVTSPSNFKMLKCLYSMLNLSCMSTLIVKMGGEKNV